MLLIQELGKREEGIDKKTGKPYRKSYGLFECPECNGQFERSISRGLKQKTCKDCRGTQNTSHGMASTRQYQIYMGIVQRCTNPKFKKYHLYGGKGIQCEWGTFEEFWEDMGDTYSDDLTIDREDSNLNYNKENCRWITHKQNSSETTKRRPVIQMRKVLKPVKGFEDVQEFESAAVAAEVLGLHANHITVVCQGKRKTHGGFGWRYGN